LGSVTTTLWKALRDFEPFGFGNPRPVFVSREVTPQGMRLVGKDRKHLKLKIVKKDEKGTETVVDAIAFNLGKAYGEITSEEPVDIVYTVDMNEWNGVKSLQLIVKDIQTRQAK